MHLSCNVSRVKMRGMTRQTTRDEQSEILHVVKKKMKAMLELLKLFSHKRKAEEESLGH